MTQNDLLYRLIYWRLATMDISPLQWHKNAVIAIIEGRSTPGLRYARRLPSNSPCPFCYDSTNLTPADHPDIPIADIIRCTACNQVHLIDPNHLDKTERDVQ